MEPREQDDVAGDDLWGDGEDSIAEGVEGAREALLVRATGGLENLCCFVKEASLKWNIVSASLKLISYHVGLSFSLLNK